MRLFEPARTLNPLRLVLLLGAIGGLGSCRKDVAPEEGTKPPPVASTKPGACAAGGGKVGDAESAAFFPRVQGSYCVDPNSEVRAYGQQSSAPLDKVCLDEFNGECEVYKSYGLDRVVTLRYVDGKGSQGEVSVVLARYTTKEGAFGFHTKRVVGGQDPLTVTTDVLDAGGAGAIGTGVAYVWRGLYVVQLTYVNAEESPDELAASSKRVLPELAKAIGERLPGEKELPAAAALLPAADRLKLGITYSYDDVLGIDGAGGGAIGHYKAGDQRWRVIALVRPDEDSAKDVMKTLKQLPGAKGEKNAPYDEVRFSRQADESSPRSSFWFGRKGARVIGVGDDDAVLTADKSKEELAKLTLDDAAKRTKLEALLASTGSAASPAAAANSAALAGSAAPTSSSR